MIKQHTVFIIGAGASYELGFPLGEGLLERIGQSLDFDPSPYGETVSKGDKYLWAAIRVHARREGGKLADYVTAAHKVRDAARLGISIDNVVHQIGDEPLVDVCAKLGIARAILDAEASCPLRDTQNGRVTWGQARGTWLGGFAQLLVQDLQRGGLDRIFDNVSVVSFNYDRNVRRILPMVLMSQFALPESDAIELSKQLKVYHPYGSLGALPWESTSERVSYGAAELDAHWGIERLLTASETIRTFTEQIEDEDHLAGMRSALSAADRVVFLGFSYLPQNMELLIRGMRGSANEVMGTVLGLSEPDQTLVSNVIGAFFPPQMRPHHKPILADTTCATFIRENFRTLTS